MSITESYAKLLLSREQTHLVAEVDINARIQALLNARNIALGSQRDQKLAGLHG